MKKIKICGVPYLYYQSDGKDVARLGGDVFWNKYWIKESGE